MEKSACCLVILLTQIITLIITQICVAVHVSQELIVKRQTYRPRPNYLLKEQNKQTNPQKQKSNKQNQPKKLPKQLSKQTRVTRIPGEKCTVNRPSCLVP